MQDNDSLLRQYGAKYGLILGAILLVVNISSIYYLAYVNTSVISLFFTSFFTSYILLLALAIGAVIILRKTVGGYWNLKQATTGIFFMFYMAFLINYIGRDIIFSHMVDPVTVRKANDRTINAYRSAQMLTKKPQKEVDANVKIMQDALSNGYNITAGGIIEYLITWVLFIFLLSIIFGALFKREPPLFRQTIEDTE